MAGDLYFHDVVLLLHCDGTDGSTTFTDSSDSGHTVTRQGDCQIDTAQKQWGTASALFDGTGDYLSAPDSTDFQFAGDFTIEFWFRLNADPSIGTNFPVVTRHQGTGNNRSWSIVVSNPSGTTTLNLYCSSDGVTNVAAGGTWTHSTGQWYFCRAKRSGSTTSIAIDGTQVGSTGTISGALYIGTNTLRVGAFGDTSGGFDGWVDDVRITKGIARTEAVPAAAFPDYREVPGTGALASAVSIIAGSGTVTGERIGTGTLAAQAATIAGTGSVVSVLSCFYGWWGKTLGADYLHRDIPAGTSATKWTFATRLFIPSNRPVAGGEMVCLWRAGDTPGVPATEFGIELSTTDARLGIYLYDGVDWPVNAYTDAEAPTDQWFDLVVHYDSANAVEADRVVVYFDKARQAFTETYLTYPARNQESFGGTVVADPHIVLNGYDLAGGTDYCGTLAYADTLFLSGRNLIPAACHDYCGGYGTADWHLRYQTSSVGTDTSGNGYDFTEAGTGTWIEPIGDLCFQFTFPITMSVMQPVVVGLPIRIDIYSAVTPSLPIQIGPYPVTPTLPIVFKTPVAVTLPSLTITFPGAYSGVLTAAGTDVITWTPKCILDGTDISSKLIGAQDIEFEETAAPVATFSFIPAAGTVDPLMYVGKPVTLSITIGTATYLAFSGVVSDPVWNADDRTITVSATGDLQSRLDAMTKTAILAQLGGTFSEYIFDDPANLSGWEYAEALISTQPKVIWQDANGFIRADSILAKASADYTFEEADILDTAQVVRWQGRLDFINKLTVSLGYRFQRRRQRNKKFSFHPYQLETPSMFLSGNEGGWELPQRSQIESAANGGGWTVIGDIRYTPVWPQGYYSTYSDTGQPMMAGLTFNQDEAGNLCIGADWTAAKRWLQTVTEQYTLVVTASDSIEAVGTLATEESYAIEDETTDEAWESSLDFDGYVSGAVVMSNGVDYKDDLDGIRTDVTTAMSVALAKAQNDVLKSHRGTTVGFMTTYDPRLDLSHTVAVDTTYLDCKGKVRRLAHHWDIDTGDATTEVEVALSRHNGTGLASTDTLTPPSEPADPTETAPATYRRLEMHIGGQDDRPVWDEEWDGYVCNVAMVGLDKFGGAAYPSTSTTSLASQYYLSNTWQRDPSNPALIGRIYEPGFHILPDAIEATYADPVEVTAASTYDVAVPEDTLTLISG